MLIAIGVATVVILAVAAGVGDKLSYGKPPEPVPDRLESAGPLELVTHTTAYQTSGATGKPGWGKTEHYSLRYHGQPFRFQGKAGEGSEGAAVYEKLNSLVTFPASEPVALVNVGDPMNTSFYFLIRESEGAVRAEFLIEGRGGVSVDWLDAAPETAPRVRDITLHRQHLEGGRFLLVGGQCVLDTQSLTKYTFPRPEGARPNPFKPALTISPDHYSLVRFGYRDGDDEEVLIVIDFVDGSSYLLPLDSKLMRRRPRNWEEIDAAWVNHHFEWKHAPGAHDRLAQRRHIDPMPYHGYLQLPRSGGGAFTLYARPGLLEPVVKLIETEFHGVRGSYPPKYSTSAYNVIAGASLAVGDSTVYVVANTSQEKLGVDQQCVSVWMLGPGGSALLKQIGDRVDAMLATREYDSQFWY